MCGHAVVTSREVHAMTSISGTARGIVRRAGLLAVAAVALTAPYQGHPRMTLTFPLLDRARCVLWVVTGPEKQAMLAHLARGDRSIPAGRVNSERAVILADAAAAAKLH
jgi:6-phosphogluconolactonase/glucosamine-6-phosphate isomerase/deaminase